MGEVIGPVSRPGATIALAIATLAGLGLAIAAPGPTVAGLCGALVLVAGLAALRADPIAHRALGSVAVLAGGALLWAPLLAGSGPGTLATLAVLLIGYTGLVEADSDRGSRLDPEWLAVVRDSSVVLASALVVVTFGTHLGALGDLLGGVAAGAMATSIGRSIVLLLECVAVVIAVGPAASVVERWTDRKYRPLSWLGLDRDGGLPNAPPSHWAALAAGLGLVLAAPALLPRVLGEIPLIGPAVVWVLTGGIVHIAVGVALAVLVAILSVEAIRRLVVTWSEPVPAVTMARASGGGAVAGVAILAGPVGPIGGAIANATPVLAGVFGVASVIVGAGLLVVGSLAIVYIGLTLAATLGPGRPTVTGFGMGAGALVCGAILSTGPVPTPVVLGVAAAGFVIWDVGTTAVDLASLGPEARTQRGELVGAAIGVLVGGLAIGVGTLAVAVLGPIALDIARWRAVLALVGVVAALLAVSPALLADRDTSA
ncbi:MAG: hypothetical protein ABEJ86_03305 [Halococcoides sp.]